MDVCEGGGVSEHFDVERPDEVLPDFFIRELFVTKFFLDVGELIPNDTILLLFRFGFPYAFDESFEVFGEMCCCHDINNYDSLILII